MSMNQMKRMCTVLVCALLLSVGVIMGQNLEWSRQEVYASSSSQYPLNASNIPSEVRNSPLYELVSSQKFDWGTFAVYRCTHTDNGFLVTLDNAGNSIAMNPLYDAYGDPLRFDAEGNTITTRLMQEARSVELTERITGTINNFAVKCCHIPECCARAVCDGNVHRVDGIKIDIDPHRSDATYWEHPGGTTSGSEAFDPYYGGWRGHPRTP